MAAIQTLRQDVAPMRPTRRLPDLAIDPGYRTGANDLIHDFYVPCLGAAARYDRAVGYFRSSLYVLIGVAMSDFAHRSGKMRLICSPHLFQHDLRAIEEGVALKQSADEALTASLRECLENPVEKPVVRLLATLVAVGALDLRLAFRPGAAGIFHDKVGIFHDSHGDRLSFLGSVNETFSAWSADANHEGFEVFRDWMAPSEHERVDRHDAYFQSLWRNGEQGVQVVEISEMSRKMLEDLADPAGVDSAAANVRQIVQPLLTSHPDTSSTPGFTRPKLLQDHQVQVVGQWFASSCRGIVKHATGAGKTIAALEMIKRWIGQNKPAIVVVPTELLAIQWGTEANAQLNGVNHRTLEVGGREGDAAWREFLGDFTRDAPELGPRLTIATMQSASTGDFLQRVRQGPHLLIVADEVHRIGSPVFGEIMSLVAGGRLGLSATPERYGDAAGTAAIFSYFGNILRPDFGLADALRVGRLVPYDYHVHRIQLTEHEQEDWNAQTNRIRQEYARLPVRNGEKLLTERYKLMLIQRARILKKATGKVSLAQDLLANMFQPDDRWLVYCDDQDQLHRVLAALRTSGLPAYEYHSAMLGSKVETLDYFGDSGGILVAIRCLDEGIDIPSVNAALVLASSTNPREFIQRRGRVLRKAPDKFSAQIHDALVTPSMGALNSESDALSIVSPELRRAIQFAGTARNSSVVFRLRALAREYSVAVDIPTGRDDDEGET